MKNYLQRFKKMVSVLHAHPKVQLLHFNTFPPCSEETFEAIEQKCGQALDSNLKAFYRETNGLQLTWILKTNDCYQPQQHRYNQEPLVWDFATQEFRSEDACIMILPIEQVFSSLDYPSSNTGANNPELDFLGYNFSFNQFYSNLYVFDAFSKFCDMALFRDTQHKRWLVLMGDEGGECYTDSRLTDFDSYIEFLLAYKGYCQKRKQFYGLYQGHEEAILSTSSTFWKGQDTLDIDTLVFIQDFPLADQPGSPTDHIHTNRMQDRAKGVVALQQTEMHEIIRKHILFLNSGGIGGRWQMISLRNFVCGIYQGAQGTQGEQAILDMQHLPHELDLLELQLPYSSWCGVHARYQDFSDADLTGSLFSDAMLEKTIFADANLQNVDFSRASLRGASFMNANLRGADFENADLTDADFRGAILEGARFPGATLKRILR
ncbi:MAG: pentapeptide repeat-containing protein [Saprospiraceae bacterium]|nr:pentapeptide repeat-containing protein [Saprospiraceae bacterium]